MFLNLSQLAKHQRLVGGRKRRVRPIKIRPSRANELWYKSQLLAIVKKVRGLAEISLKSAASSYMTEATHDEIPGWIADAIKHAAQNMGGIERQAALLAGLAAKRNLQSVDAQFISQVKSALGVDLTNLLQPDSVKGMFGKAVTANVTLIKSIPSQYFGTLEEAITKNWIDGMRQESLIDTIMHIGDVTESRAELIARDQTSKMNSSFNMVRQLSVGINKYQWQTAGDERVREEHADLDGQEFRWDDPPPDGNPGEPVNCRCIGLPIFTTEDDEESTNPDSAITSAVSAYQFGGAIGELANKYG